MNTQPDSNTNQPESERVPNTEPTAIPRPETYVLENADSAIAWQATRLSNGSLHLAFSADERLHADCLENMRQFADGERVHVHNGDGMITDARLSQFELDHRSYWRVVYTVELGTPIPGWGYDDDPSFITHLDFTELRLLDYDNPRDMHANAVTKAYDYHYQGGYLNNGAELTAKLSSMTGNLTIQPAPNHPVFCQSCSDQGVGLDWLFTKNGWYCTDCYNEQIENHMWDGTAVPEILFNGKTYYQRLNNNRED